MRLILTLVLATLLCGGTKLVGDTQDDVIDTQVYTEDFETADLVDEISRDHTDLDFNSFQSDSEITELIWCGEKNEVMIILSEDHTVYRSDDNGKSWVEKKDFIQLG